MTTRIPLAQSYYVPRVQAELAVNEWRQRACEWQAYAEWWKAYAQGQAYAQWQAYNHWQRTLQATPSSSSNNNSGTNVEASTSKRKRRASLEAFIARAQRAAQLIGLALRAVEEKADGSRVAHFGTPLEHNGDIGNPMTNPWDKVLTDAAD